MTHAGVTLVRHPLIEHMMTELRDRATPPAAFRRLVEDVASLVVYEATRDLAVREVDVETPLERTTGARLARELVVVPILRAGLAMAEGALRVVPDALVGHVGLYRDEETLRPVEYLVKLPPGPGAHDHLIVDPMLATGGSAVAAVSALRARGASRIRMACLVAAPEGVRALTEAWPDVPVFAAALDRELDASGYIRPGLGDAGDRTFGTL